MESIKAKNVVLQSSAKIDQRYCHMFGITRIHTRTRTHMYIVHAACTCTNAVKLKGIEINHKYAVECHQKRVKECHVYNAYNEQLLCQDA